jgi:hypothetical protein
LYLFNNPKLKGYKTMNHCHICRNSEHGDYGNGRYTKVRHIDYEGIIQICADHFDSENPFIRKEYKTVVKKIPYHSEPNQYL